LESSFEDSAPSIDASSENEEEIEVCCVRLSEAHQPHPLKHLLLVIQQ
jgi:hypothetical protein